MNRFFSAVLLAVCFFLSTQGIAQVLMTTSSSYTQSFNILASTGSGITWTDNSTIANWYAQRTGNGTTYNASNGSSNAGALYSFGSTSSTERSLGSLGSNNTAAGNFAWGVQLRNNSGAIITDVNVSYTMEQWRNGGNTATQSLTFWYKISSSPITSLNPNASAANGWVAVSTLNGASPINTSTAAALDGNLAANRVVLSNISIPSLSIPNGSYIMFKWDDPDHTGNEHGLSVDDVSISWTVATACENVTLTSITANNTELCGSETAILTANGVGGTNAVLTWHTAPNGGGTNLGNANPIAGLSAGTYYARVTGSCGGPLEQSIIINTSALLTIANNGISPQTSNVFSNEFIANWSSVSAATGYYIDVSTSSDFTGGGVIASEGFNNTSTLFSGSASYFSGNSATGDRPASSPFSTEGSHGAGITNGSLTLTSNAINTSSFGSPSLTFNLASFSIGSTGNGADAGDYVRVLVSPDGGATYYNTLEINGNSNAFWAFSATGGASTGYDGNATPVIFQPAGGGNRTTDGYSTITVNNLPSVINLRIQIQILNNATSERWVIDNFELQATGAQFVPGYQNLFVSGTSVNVTGLSEEVTYYYRVRVEGACGVGNNSNVVAATTACIAPTTIAAGLSTASITTTAAQVNWTNGNGSRRIVVIAPGLTLSANPSDNVTYTASTTYGAGSAVGNGYVVYNGTNPTTNITNLLPGTTYTAHIFEYNCGDGGEKFFTTSSNISFTTIPSNVNAQELCTTNASHQLGWTYNAGNFDGVMIFARPAVTSSGPGVSNAADFTGANSNFTLAADYGARGRLVYSGTGNAATITGLTTGVNYFFSFYTYVGNTSTVWSAGTSVSQPIQLNEVNTLNASPSDQTITVGWTNPAVGCFDEILVVANEGPVSFTPVGDGSVYTANSILSTSNQVVYKGSGNSVALSGLTNGTIYCYRVFVRFGTEWSLGIQGCTSPQVTTEFAPGDLAVVAVNTQVLGVGSTDEVCFVAFRDITENTSFFLTDNGYERASAELWGDTEGVFRLTRAAGASTIPAGTVICVNGPYSTLPNYEIYVCGVFDNANWIIDANVIGSGVNAFDLNSTDQVWIMQGGTWTNPTGDHDASYNGNLLYGWTGIDWKDNIGTTSPTWTTSGSRLLSGTECFTTSLAGLPNNSKSKYTGPLSPTTRLGWITRINDVSNWTGYLDNASYDGTPLAYDYINECVVFPINAPTEIAGRWTGAKDENWFDCANWETKTVPDAQTNVIIENVSGTNSNCNIDYNASNAFIYAGVATCNDLTIHAKSLILEGDVNDLLIINGDLQINGGEIDMNDNSPAIDGTIELAGNWFSASATGLNPGNGLIVMNGNSTQSITNTSGAETFASLQLNNANGFTLLNNIFIHEIMDLENGIIQTNTNTVFIGSAAFPSASVSRTNGWVNGNVSRYISSANTNYAFPIGTTTSYFSSTFTSSSLTNPGYLNTRFSADLPNNDGLPTLDADISLQQTYADGYWQTSASNELISASHTFIFNTENFTTPIMTSDRVVNRTTSDWLTNGSHFAQSLPQAARTNLSTLGDFAIASGRRCVSSLSAPSLLNQEICFGETPVAISVTAFDGEAPITYQWYQNSTNNTTTGFSLGAYPSSNTNTLLPPTDAEGDVYYYLVVSQPGTLCPTLTSTASLVTTTPIPTLSASLTPEHSFGSQVCNENTITFQLTISTGESTPNVQWFENGLPVGTNSTTYTHSGTPGNYTLYAEVTSTASCAPATVFLSNTVAFEVVAPEPYYLDNDGDGFGNPNIFVITCEPPAGYVSAPVGDINSDGLPDFDCNDDNEDIHPAVEEYCNTEDDNCNGVINEGFNTINYYQDLDGDGFGNPLSVIPACSPLLGYVTNNLDCDDNNAAIRPSAIETCDGFDDDCDGTVDEGCGPLNDYYWAALIVPQSILGSCPNNVGTLAGASVSPEANSTAITGQDVWYYFTAAEPGVSIVCTAPTTDIMIELQDDLGNTIDVENANNGFGGERLNHNALIPGNTYYVAIRNYNSAVSVGGSFQLCVQRLRASRLNIPTSGVVLRCNALNANWTNANQYIFRISPTLTINGTYAANVGGSGNTILPIANNPNFQYGAVFPNVTVDAVYAVPNGMGVLETIVVPGVETVNLVIEPQPSLQLRTLDACPNARTLNTFISFAGNFCGPVIDYQWEFTQTAPAAGLPFTENTITTSRWLRVNQIPGVQLGATYDVRIRPVYAGGIFGSWSTVPSCLQIIGPANSPLVKEDETAQVFYRNTEQEFDELGAQVNVYPNPSNGDALAISLNGFVHGKTSIRIIDNIGKVYFQQTYHIEHDNSLIQPEMLSTPRAGIYFIEIIDNDGKVFTKKWMVAG